MDSPRAIRAVGCYTLIAGALLAGCGDNGSEADASSTEAVEVVDMSDFMEDSSLADLVPVAEVVIEGEVTEVTFGRSVGDPPLEYDSFVVKVSEVYQGGGDLPELLTVELATRDDGGAIAPNGRETPAVGDSRIWLLTKIAPEFGGKTFVLLNQDSLFGLDEDGRFVGTTGDSTVRADVEKFESMDELRDYIRDLAKTGNAAE